MEDLRILYDIVSELWKHMKATINTKTEDEWEALMENEKKITNKLIGYDALYILVCNWLASWEIYVEKRNKNVTEKKIH